MNRNKIVWVYMAAISLSTSQQYVQEAIDQLHAIDSQGDHWTTIDKIRSVMEGFFAHFTFAPEVRSDATKALFHLSAFDPNELVAADLHDLFSLMSRFIYDDKHFKAQEINEIMQHLLQKGDFCPRVDKKSTLKMNHPYLESSDLISIRHGGGLEYMQRFLSKEHKGYAHENNFEGVFFTILVDLDAKTQENREYGYALKKPLDFFNTPAIINAKIRANKLLSVNHNGYEGVLLSEHVDALEDIQIENLGTHIRARDYKERMIYLRQSCPYRSLDRLKRSAIHFIPDKGLATKVSVAYAQLLRL